MMSVSYEKQNLQNQITSYLKIQAQDIVKVSNIDIDAELSNYGFDSISNVDLTNQINDYYDLDIMPTIFFELEQPTISALSMHIHAISSFWIPAFSTRFFTTWIVLL